MEFCSENKAILLSFVVKIALHQDEPFESVNTENRINEQNHLGNSRVGFAITIQKVKLTETAVFLISKHMMIEIFTSKAGQIKIKQPSGAVTEKLLFHVMIACNSKHCAFTWLMDAKPLTELSF